MKFTATQKFVVTSPRKLREVVAMFKNMKPVDAVERLPFAGKAAAEDLLKVVKTAMANAKQKSVNPDDLLFSEIQIGEGPRLKRFRAGSRGRAKPYKRRMSHIRIVLKVSETKRAEEPKVTIKEETRKEKKVEVKKQTKERKTKK